MIIHRRPPLLHGNHPLTHLGVIPRKAMRAKFLHGQLAEDFACSARSRWQPQSHKGAHAGQLHLPPTQRHRVLLVCSRDLLAATLKRLSVICAHRVKLTDASDGFALRPGRRRSYFHSWQRLSCLGLRPILTIQPGAFVPLHWASRVACG